METVRDDKRARKCVDELLQVLEKYGYVLSYEPSGNSETPSTGSFVLTSEKHVMDRIWMFDDALRDALLEK